MNLIDFFVTQLLCFKDIVFYNNNYVRNLKFNSHE